MKRNAPRCDFVHHNIVRNYQSSQQISSIFGSMFIYVCRGFQRTQNLVSRTSTAPNIMAGTHFGMFFVGIKIYSKMCYIHVIKSWWYAENFILIALELTKYVDRHGV
jgi:hypothetical protein